MFHTSVACSTPGTAATALTAAGETAGEAGPGVISTSAPVACQEAVISPFVMPWLTIPAKVARVSVSTSAKAGSAAVSGDRAARESATKPVAPGRRADSAARPRTASGYSRSMITTTGMATRIGTTVRDRFAPPAAVAVPAVPELPDGAGTP